MMSSYSCSVMMIMMESWSRGPWFFTPKKPRRCGCWLSCSRLVRWLGVLFRFYEFGACSCLRSEAMCSFSSISFSSITITSFTSVILKFVTNLRGYLPIFSRILLEKVGGTYLSLSNKNSDLNFLENFTRKVLTAALDPDFRQSQYFSLSNTEEFITTLALPKCRY